MARRAAGESCLSTLAHSLPPPACLTRTHTHTHTPDADVPCVCAVSRSIRIDIVKADEDVDRGAEKQQMLDVRNPLLQARI